MAAKREHQPNPTAPLRLVALVLALLTSLWAPTCAAIYAPAAQQPVVIETSAEGGDYLLLTDDELLQNADLMRHLSTASKEEIEEIVSDSPAIQNMLLNKVNRVIELHGHQRPHSHPHPQPAHQHQHQSLPVSGQPEIHRVGMPAPAHLGQEEEHEGEEGEEAHELQQHHGRPSSPKLDKLKAKLTNKAAKLFKIGAKLKAKLMMLELKKKKKLLLLDKKGKQSRPLGPYGAGEELPAQSADQPPGDSKLGGFHFDVHASG